MARPPKRSLNYSTWDVDVLETDPDIDKLIDAQGPAGFYIYFALCQRAYATDGYFYRWGFENAATTARKMGGGLSSAQVRTIVELCLSLGLWDKALFTGHGILTSRAIQTRYLEGIARRTGPIEIVSEYWLLDLKPVAGVVFVHKNGIIVDNNPSLGQQEQGFRTVNDITRNEMSAPTLSSPNQTAGGDVENRVENCFMDGKQRRIESCTKLLALVQSICGINYQGDKQIRRMVYALFDRAYTEQDVRAVISIVDYSSKQAQTPFPPPAAIFGPAAFDARITMPRAMEAQHPEWARDHYAPQPQQRKGGMRNRGYNSGI